MTDEPVLTIKEVASVTNAKTRQVAATASRTARMDNFSEKVSFIWSVADLLRGDYKQSEYGRVILPFAVLRRTTALPLPTPSLLLLLCVPPPCPLPRRGGPSAGPIQASALCRSQASSASASSRLCVLALNHRVLALNQPPDPVQPRPPKDSFQLFFV